MIKTWLEEAKGIWPDELPRVLWVYRTTVHTLTGETPFCLAYRHEAVLSEVGLTRYRVSHHDEGRNGEGMRLQLVLELCALKNNTMHFYLIIKFYFYIHNFYRYISLFKCGM